jgi:hypothetical protein
MAGKVCRWDGEAQSSSESRFDYGFQQVLNHEDLSQVPE